MDRVDPHTRSSLMSKIGRKDTAPEMALRRSLHGIGLRFRLHDRKLPGSPDLVFPKYKAVVFVHGCFWHSHDCRNLIPKTRQDFWLKKFADNRERDRRKIDQLRRDGWRVLVVWECALRKRDTSEIAERVATWLSGQEVEGEFGSGS